MEWVVLLPPIVAIVLALWTRQVYLSLFLGLWIGTTILVGGNPIRGLRELADQLVTVFQDAGNTRIGHLEVLPPESVEAAMGLGRTRRAGQRRSGHPAGETPAHEGRHALGSGSP